MKDGDVRIVKADALNYSVEQYRVRNEVVGKGSSRKETGKIVASWVPVGYYGNHLDWAVNSALMAKVPEGKNLLDEFKAAAQEIIKASGWSKK